MAVNEWPEITPEAMVYIDAAESSYIVTVLKQGKPSTKSLRVQTSRAPV